MQIVDTGALVRDLKCRQYIGNYVNVYERAQEDAAQTHTKKTMLVCNQPLKRHVVQKYSLCLINRSLNAEAFDRRMIWVPLFVGMRMLLLMPCN